MAKKSITRTQYRELESKITPAIKILSKQVHDTGKLPDDFIGYKVPAGDLIKKVMVDGKLTDVKWQIQVHAVCSSAHMIKKNEVKPMIRKWAIGFRVRLMLKYVVDWVNS